MGIGSSDQPADHYPACGRGFASILDYPRVRILVFERLAIPEVLDSWSPTAVARGCNDNPGTRHRRRGSTGLRTLLGPVPRRKFERTSRVSVPCPATR